MVAPVQYCINSGVSSLFCFFLLSLFVVCLRLLFFGAPTKRKSADAAGLGSARLDGVTAQVALRVVAFL